MDIDQLSIIFVRDLKKEYFELPDSVYYPFSPVQPMEPNGRYLQINFRRKDTLCYIKHKTKDLWLYEKDGRAVFKPLYCKETGFYYKQPIVCWVSYLREPTFVIYKDNGYRGKDLDYLIYNETDNKFTITWTKYLNMATVFNSNPINWDKFLSENVDVTSTDI